MLRPITSRSFTVGFVSSLRYKVDELRPKIQRYLVIYEQGPQNLSGFVPDVPGCASIGHSMVEMRENLYDALEFHLEGLALRGEPLPEPTIGFEDVVPGTLKEWMVVRLRPASFPAHTLVRPCPHR